MKTPPCNLSPRTIGTWAYARMLAKNGVSFDTAYWLVFGRFPK